MNAPSRADRLEALVTEAELDQLIVGDLVRPGDSGPDAIANIRWLTGFTGTSGLAIVGTGRREFLTDFRYTERAASEVSDEFERITVEGRLTPELAKRLRGRVGFDDAATSVQSLTKLTEALGDDAALIPTTGLVERLRRVKDAGEIEAIAEAARLADEVFEWIAERGLAGRTERDVALAAEARLREHGAEPSFPAIVAAGPHGALPHAEPSEREIGAAELVVIDMGAKLDGYCSDGTRTFASGGVGEEEREVYELVKRRSGQGPRGRSAGYRRRRGGRRVAGAHRGRGARRPLRPRPGPRRGARGPRGAASRQDLRGHARSRRRRDGRTRRLRSGQVRGPDRGPRRGHGCGDQEPEPDVEGPARSGLSGAVSAPSGAQADDPAGRSMWR